VHIDFSRPIALFPLPTVVLYPHTFEWMVAFEPRYRQMVEDCLRARGDGPMLDAAPIAMATYAGRGWSGERVGDPPLRPAVCVGQIVQHERLADGRHTILLHGICRARIERIDEADGTRLYRQATLRPIEPPSRTPPRMPEARRALRQLLLRPRVQRMASVKSVTPWAERGDIPTHAMIELVGAALLQDEPARYAMLASGDPWERARMVAQAIARLEGVVAGAEAQHPENWPKGLSWN